MQYIRLAEEEKREFENLHKTSTNPVIRSRCLCLLSDKGNSMVHVSHLLNIHWHTVDRLLSRWNTANVDDKFSVVYSGKGKGAKIKLQPVAELLPEFVEKHSRSLKSILDVLEKEHSIKVSKLTLQSFLKDAGL